MEALCTSTIILFPARSSTEHCLPEGSASLEMSESSCVRIGHVCRELFLKEPNIRTTATENLNQFSRNFSLSCNAGDSINLESKYCSKMAARCFCIVVIMSIWWAVVLLDTDF